MEDASKTPLTVVDRIADGEGLQMAKAAIPYLPGSIQKAFSVYIKMMEVSNILSYYNNPLQRAVRKPGGGLKRYSPVLHRRTAPDDRSGGKLNKHFENVSGNSENVRIDYGK